MSRSNTVAVVVFLLIGVAMPLAVGTAAADDVTLTITVINQNGDPVPGVDVTASWEDDSVTGSTSANGQVLLDVPEGEDVEVDVEGSGYMRNHPRVVEDAETSELTVSVAEDGHARIIVSDENGPVQGATVRFIASSRVAASDETDASGTAESGTIEQGLYTVTVRKPGYLEHSERVRVSSITEEEVTIEEAITQVDFTVRDDRFDPPRPVEDARISIEPIGSSLVTLGNGGALTTLPANQEYDVEITKSGYESVSTNLSVGEEDTTLVANISRTPDVSMSAANNRVVVGETTEITVRDEYDRPLDDLPLTVDGEEVARTNADGEADVEIESVGNVTISASHGGAEDSVTIEGVGSADEDGEDGDEGETDGGLGPGFGIAAALGALIAAALALVRRH